MAMAEICDALAAARRGRGEAADELAREAAALRARLTPGTNEVQPEFAAPIAAAG